MPRPGLRRPWRRRSARYSQNKEKPMSSLSQEFMQYLAPVLPEAIMLITALLVLLFDLVIGKEGKVLLGWLSVAGIAMAASISLETVGVSQSVFSGTFLVDPFSTFFKFVIYIACGLGILLSINYLKVEKIHRGEY